MDILLLTSSKHCEKKCYGSGQLYMFGRESKEEAMPFSSGRDWMVLSRSGYTNLAISLFLLKSMASIETFKSYTYYSNVFFSFNE